MRIPEKKRAHTMTEYHTYTIESGIGTIRSPSPEQKARPSLSEECHLT